jgi:uncharacterized repeat protein (TIGR03803 family)
MKPATLIAAIGVAAVAGAYFNGPEAHAATYGLVYSFCGQQNCVDGDNPRASLLEVNNILYGTTAEGGAHGDGTVFSFDPTTGIETALHSFGAGADGQQPFADLVELNGALYGTTVAGGKYGYGTVFSLDPVSGAEAVLHSFGKHGDGQNPYADLQNVKGTLYGTTAYGGAAQDGIIFSLDPKTGRETVLHSFGKHADGQRPYAGLLNVNGMLYGTTVFGGARGVGTIFSFDPTSGAETILYDFRNGADGRYPFAGLLDVGGTIYGDTVNGGTYGYGAAYSFDPATDVETILHAFGGSGDGQYPYAQLIELNGTLYGTTYDGGGTFGWGIAYSLDPKTGNETILYNFGAPADSALPFAGLVNVNGTLYGVAATGGADGGGTVYSLTP